MQAGLSLRVSQHLALTPQLQQSIRLLQLSTLEMEQEIEHMLGDNPFLERDEADSSNDNNDSTSNDSAQPPTSAPDSRAEEPLDAIDSGAASADQERAGAEFDAIPTDWEGEGSFDDADGPGGAEGIENLLTRSSASAPGDDGSEAFERVAQHESLAEHLHRQALALRLGPADRAALYFLIESLTDDGYLPDPLPSLAEHLCESTDPEDASKCCTTCRWRWACCSTWSLPVWAHATWHSAWCCNCGHWRARARRTTPPCCKWRSGCAANRWSYWLGATCANWPSCATARASRCARHWR